MSSQPTVKAAHGCIVMWMKGDWYYLVCEREDGQGCEFAPGGALEPTDNGDPEIAIRREHREELGLSSHLDLHGRRIITITEREMAVAFFVFMASPDLLATVDKFAPTEEVTAVWWSPLHQTAGTRNGKPWKIRDIQCKYFLRAARIILQERIKK